MQRSMAVLKNRVAVESAAEERRLKNKKKKSAAVTVDLGGPSNVQGKMNELFQH
jgi:hypothetical protein